MQLTGDWVERLRGNRSIGNRINPSNRALVTKTQETGIIHHQEEFVEQVLHGDGLELWLSSTAVQLSVWLG